MSRHLTLYAKPGCHLCEELRALLDDMRGDFGLIINDIDITADETLFARYRYDIPVLLMEGREIARGQVREDDLVRVFKDKRHKAEGKN